MFDGRRLKQTTELLGDVTVLRSFTPHTTTLINTQTTYRKQDSHSWLLTQICSCFGRAVRVGTQTSVAVTVHNQIVHKDNGMGYMGKEG